MKKVYKVGFYYQESGFVNIEANSEAEAEAIAQNVMGSEGIEFEFECTDRDFGTTCSNVAYEGATSALNMSNTVDYEEQD